MLKQLNQEFGQTIVMITHNSEAAAFADSILHMRDGRILETGSSGEPVEPQEEPGVSQFE